MKVMVFGATGFLGQHVTPALRDAGHTVLSVGRSGAVDITCAVVDRASIEEAIREAAPEIVVNLLGAGLSDSSADQQEMESMNSSVPIWLAQSIIAINPGIQLIHAASSTEQPSTSGEFESDYSRTKAAGTRALAECARESSGPVTILRIHNTYGADQPRNRFIASVIDRCLAGEQVALNYPDRVRDFVHIDDVAAAFVDACRVRGEGLSEFEVGTGTGTSLVDVATIIAVEAGVGPDTITQTHRVDHHPITVADPGELIRRATIALPDGIRRVVQERRQGVNQA